MFQHDEQVQQPEYKPWKTKHSIMLDLNALWPENPSMTVGNGRCQCWHTRPGAGDRGFAAACCDRSWGGAGIRSLRHNWCSASNGGLLDG